MLQFTPWAPAISNVSNKWFTHDARDIPPPESLNQSVLRNLDNTFDTIDSHLTQSLEATAQNIDNIEEQPDNTVSYTGYAALTFSLLAAWYMP